MKVRQVLVVLAFLAMTPAMVFAGKGGSEQDMFMNPVDKRTENYISGRFG